MIKNKARLYTAFLALKEEEWIGLLTLHEVSSSSAADYIAVIWGAYLIEYEVWRNWRKINTRCEGIWL